MGCYRDVRGLRVYKNFVDCIMCCNGLAKTVKNGQRIATGFAYLAAGVNEELSQRRVKICNNCPHLRGGLICGFCGCEIHAKTRLPEEQCADEKNRRWLAETA